MPLRALSVFRPIVGGGQDSSFSKHSRNALASIKCIQTAQTLHYVLDGLVCVVMPLRALSVFRPLSQLDHGYLAFSHKSSFVLTRVKGLRPTPFLGHFFNI